MEEYQLRLFKTEIANQWQSVLSAEDDLERYFQTIDQLGQQLLQEAARSDCDPSRLFNLKNQFPEVGRVMISLNFPRRVVPQTAAHPEKPSPLLLPFQPVALPLASSPTLAATFH